MVELHGIATQLRDLHARYDADKRPIEAFSISGVMPAGPADVGAFAVSKFDKQGKKVGQEYVRHKRVSLSELAVLKDSVGVAGVGVSEERAYPDHVLYMIAEGEKLGEYIQEAGKLLLAAVNSGGFTPHPELRDLIQKTGAAVQGKRDAEFAFGRLGAIYANATEFWLFKQRPELRPFVMIGNQIVAPDNQTTNVISFHGSCAAFADLLEAEQPPAAATPTATIPRRKSRQRTPTEKQLEALKVVGECEQNWAEAARRLNKSEKTVRQLYQAGLRNAGKLASKLIGKPSVRPAPMDRRGQSIIATDDDGPAAIGPRANAVRDRR